MPITGQGWEFHVIRLGLHKSGPKPRTYGEYQVYLNGQKIDTLSGHVCECTGPGDLVRDSGHRIKEGRYPLSTQFRAYKTIGYSEDLHTPGKPPMPAMLLTRTKPRVGILIHPGHPPTLYISSIGCLNPTHPLNPSDKMDFWDSRSRVIALIDDLRRFAPAAFQHKRSTLIPGAWAVIDSEPMNVLTAPATV
jgi:hypothetical protein